MAIPDIYDLSHFNKKTQNIVVSIHYINNRLEITHNDHIEYDDHFIRNINKPPELYYNIQNSSTIIDLICKGLYGFYKSDFNRWVCINSDCIVRITTRQHIYFHKINIPHGFCMSSFSCTIFSNNMQMPFLIFSNEPIEPILCFDMTKMKYIKKYISYVPDTKYKIVYMIYKFHNMVFIYISHITDDMTEYKVAEWDKTRKEFIFNEQPKYMLQEIYNNSEMINFRPIIGDYKHVLVYDYR